MIFETMGDRSQPAILMIHGMFCNSNSVKRLVQEIQNDYYVIMPTLDGHYKGSPDYETKEQEAAKIIAYLKKEKIHTLAMLQGTSMGAEIALEVARQAKKRINIEHYFFDGEPFFHFPGIFRLFMRIKFQFMIRSIQKGEDCEQQTQKLLKSKMVRWLLGEYASFYHDMIYELVQVGKTVSTKTVKNVTQTCYHCILPKFDEAIVKKFIFFYSKNEPAYKAKKRLKAKYPLAAYRDVPKYGHCGYQTVCPEKYIKYLCKIIHMKGYIPNKPMPNFYGD